MWMWRKIDWTSSLRFFWKRGSKIFQGHWICNENVTMKIQTLTFHTAFMRRIIFSLEVYGTQRLNFSREIQTKLESCAIEFFGANNNAFKSYQQTEVVLCRKGYMCWVDFECLANSMQPFSGNSINMNSKVFGMLLKRTTMDLTTAPQPSPCLESPNEMGEFLNPCGPLINSSKSIFMAKAF